MGREDAHRLSAKFLMQWCRARSYIQACAAEESQRFNLDGTHAAAVSLEERSNATRTLFGYGAGDVSRAMKMAGGPPSKKPAPVKKDPVGGESLVAGKMRPVLGLGGSIGKA